MADREKLDKVLQSNRTFFVLLLLMISASITIGGFLTEGGSIPHGLDLEVAKLILGIFSVINIVMYGIVTKKNQTFSFAVLMLAGVMLEHRDNLFVINNRINISFLGFYMMFFLIYAYILISQKDANEHRFMDYDIFLVMGILIVIGYFLILQYIMVEPVFLRGRFVPILELVKLLSIPVFAIYAYNRILFKGDLVNFAVYLGALVYTASMLGYSAFYQLIDYRFLLGAQILETLSFSIYLVFVPLEVVRQVREKEKTIKKSEQVKNNLYMFFRSAEHSENIVVFVNAEHEVIYSNSAYRNLMQDKGKELIPEFKDSLVEHQEDIRSKKYYSYSHAIPLNGNLFIFDVDVVLVEQNGEEIYAMTARDVTVLKIIQDSLELSEKKYRNFFNLIPDFLFLYDIGEQRVIEANQAVYENFPVDQEAFDLSRPESRFLGFSDTDIEAMAMEAEEEERFHTETLRIIGKDGDSIVVEPNIVMVEGEKGARQVLVFLRNMTKSVKLQALEKEHEANLRKLFVAKEQEKLMNEFFANISHELRTPINIILSALDLISINNYNPRKTKQYSKIIKHNSFRLLKIVNNILDSTKMDAGYYKISLKNVDIISFTENVVTSVLDFAENKGLSVVFDTDFEEHIIAFDPESLEKVILNLLSNAFKFTPEGGSILTTVSQEEGNILIRVEDNGIGIPGESMDIIFDRFIQVNKSTTRDHEGTGIGLSIVKKLMELMGGQVKVESTLGKGTAFTLSLLDRIVREEDREDLSKQFDKPVTRVEVEFSDI